MKLLLALDCSEASQVALAEVLARKWPARSEVDVITVIEPAHVWETSETANVLYRRSADLLRTALERLRGAGLVADGDVLEGHARQAILDRAAERRPQMIVLGCHAVSAVEHFLLGNVAVNIVRRASCSVLIARPKPVSASGPRILLATDGSPFSDAAARSLATRPWPKGGQVRVMSVIDFALPTAVVLFEPPLVASKTVQSARERAMEHAQQAVHSACATLNGNFDETSESISVLFERPEAAILREAKTWNADLIVLGSHGRHGLQHLLLGSVAEAVATYAQCSVEVIR